MDGTRFDSAARAIATGTSRRAVLRGLIAGIAGVLTAKALPASAAAIPLGDYCNFDVECVSHGICQGGICRCASGFKPCGTQCIPSTQTCLVCGAGGPIKPCSGGCTDTRSDRNNCGYCGNTCGIKQICSNSHCCPQGKIWCDGVCKPLNQCT
jgi:hypothetical protein